MNRTRRWHYGCLATVAMLGMTLSACGDTPTDAGAQPTSVDSSERVTESPSPTPDPSPSPTDTPSPRTTPEATGRVIQFRIKDNDGFNAILKMTFSPVELYKGMQFPDLFRGCMFSGPPSDRTRIVAMKVQTEVIPETADGFTWPDDGSVSVSVPRSDAGVYCDDKAVDSPASLQGPYAKPASPALGWVLFTSTASPKLPNGWKSPGPWTQIDIAINDTYIETCTVVTKDKGFVTEPTSSMSVGCDFQLHTPH